MLLFANSEVLSNLGFDVSLAGENVISIRSIPDILSKSNIEELIRDVISDLIQHENSNRVEHIRNELLATMSCHSCHSSQPAVEHSGNECSAETNGIY